MFLFSVVECVFVLVASLFPCALSWSQVDLFFIVWGLGDGFVNDTAGKAISAEGAITFFSAVACGRRYSLWIDDAFVVFSDDLGHIFHAAVA